MVSYKRFQFYTIYLGKEKLFKPNPWLIDVNIGQNYNLKIRKLNLKDYVM